MSSSSPQLDEATVNEQVQRAAQSKLQIEWVETYGPALAGSVGLVFLLGGAALVVRSARKSDPADEPLSQAKQPDFAERGV